MNGDCFDSSVIEISRSALKHNYQFIDEILGETTISSVVKGNAYGHGLEEFVPLAESAGVDRFAVFSASRCWNQRSSGVAAQPAAAVSISRMGKVSR